MANEDDGFGINVGDESIAGFDSFADPGDASVAGFDSFADPGDATVAGFDFADGTENMDFGDNFPDEFFDSDPVSDRLSASGLFPGGRSSMANPAQTNVLFQNASQGGRSRDWKVRISVKMNIFDGIMGPLGRSNGVVFPFTPDISVNYTTNYSMQRFTHSNYQHPIYENSDVSSITVNGDFVAQNRKDADYVLACVWFFRTVTKMFFGQDGSAPAGNPPPLVYLTGYGDYIFKQTPCIVTQFTHNLPNDVDYVQSSRGTRIPTTSKLNVTLQPVYSKKSLTQFSLDDFAAGRLINKGFI